MNKEIKDILLKLQILKNTKEIDEYHIDKEDGVRLLNYITNLQEDIETYRIQSNYFINRSDDLEEENERLKELNVCVGCNNNPDYKSRIDKAVEIYKNRNTCKYKKERFMEDKSASDLMYETLTGGNE